MAMVARLIIPPCCACTGFAWRDAGKSSEWGKRFRGHLQVAIDLHHIKQAIIMAAVTVVPTKAMLGEDFAKTAAEAGKLPPDLMLKTVLMSLDGAVEVIAA